MNHRYLASIPYRRRALSVLGILSAALVLACGPAAADPPAAKQAPKFLATANQRPSLSTVIEVVVKFKDDSKVREIIDTFWKDPKAAKARFDTFKLGRPEMIDATLDRVTYSNELVLIYPSVGDSKSARSAATGEIVRRLSASSDISYAEPDATVQAQQ